jgi:monoamine oxidase
MMLGILGAGAVLALGGAGCSPSADDAAEPSLDQGRPPTGRRVPAPAAMIRTSWSTDPYAGGAYSAMVVGAEPGHRRALAAPVGDRWFFAGEATSNEHPGTVHGALASGRRAAAQVAERARPGERIVVIGAGIAGLAAARQLAGGGFDVTVIEARDRIGGRLHSVRPDGWGLPLDLGASWVHDVRASELAALLRAEGIATAPFDYADAAVLTGSGRRSASTLERVMDRVDDAVRWADGRDPDRSIADALRASGIAASVDTDLLRSVLEHELAGEYGESAERLSAWWALEEGSDGDDTFVLGGYDALASAFGAGVRVERSRPVTDVARTGNGVRITDAAGGTTEAERVVVTVPLGVLQQGGVRFDPPLPAGHRTAIARLGMGVIDKVWLRFDEAFWSQRALVWIQATPGDSPLRWWVNLMPLTGRPVLLAVLGGDTARAWATRSDAEILAAATESLQRFVDAGW